jgi:hypothetical protein
MIEYLVNNRLILDTGDYLGFACALLADRDVNIEHTLQALPRSLTITLMMLGTFATFGRRHIYSVFAVGRDKIVWNDFEQLQLGKAITLFPSRNGL